MPTHTYCPAIAQGSHVSRPATLAIPSHAASLPRRLAPRGNGPAAGAARGGGEGRDAAPLPCPAAADRAAKAARPAAGVSCLHGAAGPALARRRAVPPALVAAPRPSAGRRAGYGPSAPRGWPSGVGEQVGAGQQHGRFDAPDCLGRKVNTADSYRLQKEITVYAKFVTRK